MTLITVVIGLILDRYMEHLDEKRRLDWYRRYVIWSHSHLGVSDVTHSTFGLALILGPLLVATLIVSSVLHAMLFGVLGLAFDAGVLLFCLGPRDLEAQIGAYLDASAAHDGIEEEAIAGALVEGAVPMEPAARVLAVTEGVLAEANNRLFAVLFWFMVLGPFGAVLYRASAELLRIEREQEGEPAPWTERLVALLDWLPARLTVLGYALAGHFDATASVLRRYLFSIDEPLYPRNRSLLREAGRAALGPEVQWLQAGLDPQPRFAAALSMITRSLLIWIVLLALLTLAGWVG
jgi:AmpE protein